MLTDFQNSSILTFSSSGKFKRKWQLKTPPHLERFATIIIQKHAQYDWDVPEYVSIIIMTANLSYCW